MIDRVGFEPVRATIVAFYGEKPRRLADFVVELHERLDARLGPAFTPYALDQVHATVVGLEGERSPATGELFNRNYAELRREQRIMNVDAALRRISRSPAFPLTVRIGGFARDVDHGFTSRGQPPYRRSFSLEGRDAVAMGWPWHDGTVSTALASLRRELESEGVLHKYHATPDLLDNDVFFVVGRVERSRVDQPALEEAAEEVRERMAASAFELVVERSDLKRVVYTDASLPLDSSRPATLPGGDCG